MIQWFNDRMGEGFRFESFRFEGLRFLWLNENRNIPLRSLASPRQYAPVWVWAKPLRSLRETLRPLREPLRDLAGETGDWETLRMGDWANLCALCGNLCETLREKWENGDWGIGRTFALFAGNWMIEWRGTRITRIERIYTDLNDWMIEWLNEWMTLCAP